LFVENLIFCLEPGVLYFKLVLALLSPASDCVLTLSGALLDSLSGHQLVVCTISLYLVLRRETRGG
jgi:hypothetical protein